MFARTRHCSPLACVLYVLTMTAGGVWPEETAAQNISIAPSDSGTVAIAGFGGLDWGVGRKAVQSRWGVPDTVRSVPSLAADALIYSDRSILGETGAMGFLVHPDSGLVRGLYLLPYGSGDDCQRLYIKFREAMGRSLGRLQGRESMINQTDDLDFCTAFQLGQARAQTVWKDSVRDTRAWIRLDRSAGSLRVSYESRTYQLLRETAQRRSTERWLGGGDSGRGHDEDRTGSDTLFIPMDSTGSVRDTAELGG